MVGKNTIKEFGFETIEEYYEYIVDSVVNGQIRQANGLIQELSHQQKKKAYVYLDQDDNRYYNEVKGLIFNQL